MIIVHVATDFSRHPAGRHLTDGPFSGELFRNRFLEPNLRKKERVVVEFAGIRGAGSSFLEEAFGGLVRRGYPKELLRELLEVRHPTNPSVPLEVRGYIERATPIT